MSRPIPAEERCHVEVHLVTPEPDALAVFGPGPGHAVAEILRDAGVRLHLDAFADVTAGHRLVLMPGANTLDVERVVALPRLVGHGFPGLPCDVHGFLPTDEHGRVRGVADVYASRAGWPASWGSPRRRRRRRTSRSRSPLSHGRDAPDTA